MNKSTLMNWYIRIIRVRMTRRPGARARTRTPEKVPKIMTRIAKWYPFQNREMIGNFAHHGMQFFTDPTRMHDSLNATTNIIGERKPLKIITYSVTKHYAAEAGISLLET